MVTKTSRQPRRQCWTSQHAWLLNNCLYSENMSDKKSPVGYFLYLEDQASAEPGFLSNNHDLSIVHQLTPCCSALTIYNLLRVNWHLEKAKKKNNNTWEHFYLTIKEFLTSNVWLLIDYLVLVTIRWSTPVVKNNFGSYVLRDYIWIWVKRYFNAVKTQMEWRQGVE